MVARIAGLILVGAALAACSGPGIFAPSSGKVSGHVLIRACGGANRPDQPGCPSHPFAGARISFNSGGTVVTATADSQGAYQVQLRPGTYSAQVNAEPFSRVAGPRQVTVTAGKSVTADFTYVVQLL
ncbi:MAG TPA: carboxypeptidase-like regulatory domain-containing protein [Candidatus Dormibacteraeota bacterium]|nr:carboxypeptidase-like regulatory domain-containing protein [Candidatus Dormibacteraeota bacterium]